MSSKDIDLLVQKIASVKNTLFTKQRHKSIYAIRNALLIPEVFELACSQPVISWANIALSSQARPVKAFLFDKTPEANWKVAWHQDLTIAVKSNRQ